MYLKIANFIGLIHFWWNVTAVHQSQFNIVRLVLQLPDNNIAFSKHFTLALENVINVLCVVLSSENQRKGSIAPYIRSSVMDEERMIDGWLFLVKVSALTQVLDNRKGIWHIKLLCRLSPKVLFGKKWRKKSKRNHLTQFQLENCH